MTYTRNTIATIRLNAEKMTVSEIAKACGVSESLVRRIAAEQKIDLHLRVYSQQEPPDREPLSADALNRPDRQRFWPQKIGRTEQVATRLFPSDARRLEAAGSRLGLRRGAALTRLVENARDRGLIEDLVRLPAPKPQKEEGA